MYIVITLFTRLGVNDLAVLEFIKGKYKHKKALQEVINYVMDDAKTRDDLKGGHFCNPSSAYHEFLLTKERYDKIEGRQVVHLVQSFSPLDEITPEEVYEIAEKFLQHDLFKGFQITYATHINRDHLHTHFIINTVNYETGRKWQQSVKDIASLRALSDQICQDYGLEIIEKGQKRQMSTAAFRLAQKGKNLHLEATRAVNLALKDATTQQEFFANMKMLGYETQWYQKENTIYFVAPNGDKIRDTSLYPKGQFNKDYIGKQLALNNEDPLTHAHFITMANKVATLREEGKMFPLSFLVNEALLDKQQAYSIYSLGIEVLNRVSNPDGDPSNLSDCGLSHLDEGSEDFKNKIAERKKGSGFKVKEMEWER